MILKEDFTFFDYRLVGYNHKGQWLEIENGFCKIKEGAYSNGATWARDENAYFTWFFHDNGYADKTHSIPRKILDLVMLDMLKKENFAWFRYKWVYGGKGIRKMRYVYYAGVRIFGSFFK